MSDGKSFLKVDSGGSEGATSFFCSVKSCGICLSGVFVGIFSVSFEGIALSWFAKSGCAAVSVFISAACVSLSCLTYNI